MWTPELPQIQRVHVQELVEELAEHMRDYAVHRYHGMTVAVAEQPLHSN